jgi:NDP-sugar pyrophosphorylase family protein
MKAVILAGGLGTRLRPFTDIIPKPLLPLGDRTLMEIQLQSLKRAGFDEIFVATNYKSELVKAYLGSGSKYGVSIHFSQEDKPLGTCGPLSLLRDRLTEPFLLTNGDILTKLDYRQMFDFAMKRRASLCVGTKIITTPFRFGNVTVDSEENIIQVDEKPDFSLEVVAGIYCMKPTIFEFIPSNEYFGMDSLIKKMIAAGVPVARYQIEDYWIDIGQVEDYSRARQVVEENILTPNE